MYDFFVFFSYFFCIFILLTYKYLMLIISIYKHRITLLQTIDQILFTFQPSSRVFCSFFSFCTTYSFSPTGTSFIFFFNSSFFLILPTFSSIFLLCTNSHRNFSNTWFLNHCSYLKKIQNKHPKKNKKNKNIWKTRFF